MISTGVSKLDIKLRGGAETGLSVLTAPSVENLRTMLLYFAYTAAMEGHTVLYIADPDRKQYIRETKLSIETDLQCLSAKLARSQFDQDLQNWKTHELMRLGIAKMINPVTRNIQLVIAGAPTAHQIKSDIRANMLKNKKVDLIVVEQLARMQVLANGCMTEGDIQYSIIDELSYLARTNDVVMWAGTLSKSRTRRDRKTTDNTYTFNTVQKSIVFHPELQTCIGVTITDEPAYRSCKITYLRSGECDNIIKVCIDSSGSIWPNSNTLKFENNIINVG